MSSEAKNETRSLIVWRESVCMGDDADAPHELHLPITPDTSLLDLAKHIREKRYLASIAGGKATWILEGREAIAVFAQQWDQPRFIVSAEKPLLSLAKLPSQPQFMFLYWGQVDPEQVFECLQRGEPLPDKYGR